MQELHIYNMLLAERDFTVYYERPLIAGGEDRFPDFTVRNKQTDTVFFWEHFGLSEKGAYMDNMYLTIKNSRTEQLSTKVRNS